MDLSLRAPITPDTQQVLSRPILLLIDPAVDADPVEIGRRLAPLVDGNNAVDICTIEDGGVPADLAAWSSAYGELVVLVSDCPDIRQTIGLECQRLRIPLCRLEIPAADRRSSGRRSRIDAAPVPLSPLRISNPVFVVAPAHL